MSDTNDSPSPSSPAPLEIFFSSFTVRGFSYTPTTSANKNFALLCKASGWVGNSPQRVDARRSFKDALVQQFNFLYGVDANDLNVWQNLCKTIGIEPVPDSVDECRTVGGNTFCILLRVLKACMAHTASLGRTRQHCRSH